MKLIFASDSFKGTISSKRISEMLTEAAKEVFGDCKIIAFSVGDGGEGTAEAVFETCGGEKVFCNVHDPLMNPLESYYVKILGKCAAGDNNISRQICKTSETAIIETALAIGLPLVPPGNRNPMKATSFGAGELVKAALQNGHKDIIVTLGGSATNDGGMGFLRALSVRFLDGYGKELSGTGADLCKIADIDASGLIPEARNASFTAMCDVKNPLCGETGATFTYGKQKGADKETLRNLEEGMMNFRDVIKRRFGIDPDKIPGAGAAGGLGAALKVFLNANLKPGIETVLDLSGFDDIIKDADLIVTGEGCIDSQSLNGKAVMGVGDRALKAGIPAVALCGCTGDGYDGIFGHGIKKVWTTKPLDMKTDEAMERAEELYLKAAFGMFKEIKEKGLH